MIGYKIIFDKIDWKNPTPELGYKVFIKDNKKLRIVEFSTEFIEPDWCEKGHIGLVIIGSMQIAFADQGLHDFATDDAIYIPARAEHKHHHFISIETTTLFLVEDI